MFYIYRSFSVAGWIAAAVFFAFLLGFLWGQRRARRREPEPRGFDVTPPSEPTVETTTTTTTTTAEQTTDAKHP